MGILTELRPIRTRTRASTAQSLTLEVDTTTKSVSRLQMVAIAGWVAQTADTAHATTNHLTTRGSKIERKTMKEVCTLYALALLLIYREGRDKHSEIVQHPFCVKIRSVLHHLEH